MRFAALLAAAALFAQPADPITDKLRYQIAAAQRDYLAAKQQFDLAAAAVRAKLGEAEKACGEKRFDLATFECVEVSK